MTDPRPLWKVMRNAYDTSCQNPEDWTEADGFAAILRAIAEEMKRRIGLLNPGYNLTPEEIMDWLLDEADRAEVGG